MATTRTMMNPNPTLNLFHQHLAPRWRTTLRRLFRRSPQQLLDLKSLAQCLTIRGRHAVGRQMVPIAAIVGSESRMTDFDAAFRPCARYLTERWCRVAEAWENGTALPPVELIRVGDRYFVRDGHHRISVAATYGAQEIEALVTVWEVDSTLPKVVPGIEPLHNETWTTETPAVLS